MADSKAETNVDNGPVEIHSLATFPDLSTFTSRKTYPALIAPVKRIAELRRTLSQVMLRLPKIKSVYPAESSNSERILVLQNQQALSDPVVQKLLEEQECRTTKYSLELSYTDMSSEEVLRKILPFEEIPSAFEAVGHVAHLNLREECLPYKYWIGKVIFDKNQPRVKTVVNKLGNIENEFRTFGMEVIAGDDSEGWSHVTVKEEGCTFQLDFRQVYWNSRLAGEHKRLVALIHSEAKKSSRRIVVADLMAGVGPFAIPLTAGHTGRDVTVYANDLNPASFEYLKINSKKNRCENLHCYNQDGRAFLHHLCREGVPMDHVIMNLPASAPEFLDAFRGFTHKAGAVLPRIHVHCFAPKLSESTDYQCAVDRCAQALGHPLDREANDIHIRVVRDVSPKKNMLCVSFRLPEAVCRLPPIQTGRTDDGNIISEPDAKRLKPDA